MLTVIVGLVGSGKRRTVMPFARRYSVMPSTEVTLTGLPGAAAAGFAAGADFAAGFEVAACGAAARATAARNARSRLEPPLFRERIGILHTAPATSVGPGERGKRIPQR